VILSGRCYERESVPYKAFDSLVDSLTRYLRRLPSVDAAALMPRDIHALARVFPVLERVPVVLEAPRRAFESPDQQELRRRAFRGLREILAKIADRHPLILRIEDMQWGDEDSARLLADILAPPDPPGLLLIGVYRNDEAASSPMLAELRRLYGQAALSHDVRNLAVGALSATEARALALALFGRDDHPARNQAAMIARESDGSPLFVEELVRQVDTSASDDLGELDISLEGVVRSRLRQLSATARTLLEILAIASRPLGQGLVLRAMGGQGDASVAMTQLRALHMVRTRGHHEDATIECYHDRIRETVAATIPVTRQRAHHRALAEALEVSGEADLEIVAQHFHSAGERERAAHYAAAAAERAAAALAFNRAADLYRLARTWSPPRGPQIEELLIRHADALVHAGRCGEAAPLYLEAAESATAATAIELRRRAAEQFLVSGRIDEGVKILRPLLAAVRLSYPTTPGRANLSILARQTQLSLRGLGFTPRPEERIGALDLRRVDVCWSACKGLNFVDPIRGYAFALRGLILALQIGEPRRVARGLATVGMAMMSRGTASSVERGTALVKDAESHARALEDPYLIGLTKIIDGIANITLGRWQDALDRIDAGVQILHDRCAGIAWESSVAQMGSMRALLSLGRFRELKVRASAWRREAEDAGDLYSEVWAALFWAYARVSEGEADEARDHTRAAIERWSHDGFHFQHLLALAVETLCDLYVGRPLAAWNRLAERWPAVEDSLILGWQFLRIFALQLRSSAAIAAANATPGETRRLLEAASEAADELQRHAGDRDDGRATVAAIRAGIAATHGDRRQTLDQLERAISGFEAAGMRMSAACALRRLGEALAGDIGAAKIAEADAALKRQGIVDPARWTRVLLPGFASNDS
ncbi:MAG: AAA family ATPase, partial [Myxococcales bacterium]|nr:AAA family ATPase [Myxococcales bacterium]